MVFQLISQKDLKINFIYNKIVILYEINTLNIAI